MPLTRCGDRETACGAAASLLVNHKCGAFHERHHARTRRGAQSEATSSGVAPPRRDGLVQRCVISRGNLLLQVGCGGRSGDAHTGADPQRRDTIPKTHGHRSSPFGCPSTHSVRCFLSASPLATRQVSRIKLVLSGSFNPLHDGHVQLLKRAAEVVRLPASSFEEGVQAFEICTANVDKAPIDVEQLMARVEAFVAVRAPLVVTCDEQTFVQKAEVRARSLTDKQAEARGGGASPALRLSCFALGSLQRCHLCWRRRWRW
jgi:hypothetical protein